MACIPSPPHSQLPVSPHTVGVSIIDTTSRLTLPSTNFVAEKIAGHSMWTSPSYSFLLEHAGSGEKLLWDLGLRTDFENLAPAAINPMLKLLEDGLIDVSVEKDVATILEDEGIDVADIDAIFWR